MKNKLAVSVLAPRLKNSRSEGQLLHNIQQKYGPIVHDEMKAWLDNCRVWYHLDRNNPPPGKRELTDYCKRLKSYSRKLQTTLTENRNWATLIQSKTSASKLYRKEELLNNLFELVNFIDSNEAAHKGPNRGRNRNQRAKKLTDDLRSIFRKHKITFTEKRSDIASVSLSIGLKISPEAASKYITRSQRTK